MLWALWTQSQWRAQEDHIDYALFSTPWSVACQALLSMGFFRQESWSGLPFPSPGDLPNPGIEPGCPPLQADSLMPEPPGKSKKTPYSKHDLVLNRFSCVQFFMTLQTVAHKPICPWDSSGNNTGVGCHALLQGIFPIQGLNPCFLSVLLWQAGPLPLVPLRKPLSIGIVPLNILSVLRPSPTKRNAKRQNGCLRRPYKQLRKEEKLKAKEKRKYTHLNSGFQRIARRDKKAFLSDQLKEIEENNRMGKTRDLFKKIRDTKGTFHVKMGTIKDRNRRY